MTILVSFYTLSPDTKELTGGGEIEGGLTDVYKLVTPDNVASLGLAWGDIEDGVEYVMRKDGTLRKRE